MDESSQRELQELRALLAKHGPASVLSTVGALCAEEAKAPGVTDVELWEVAADAASGAAASLLGDDDEDQESEDDAGEDEDDAAGGEETAVANETTDEELAEAGDGEETTHDEARPEEQRGAKMTIKDPRLGQRPANATHWRCFRVCDDAGAKKWDPLTVDERGDGIHTNEWPIKTCTADALAERWGDGRFIVQYMRTEDGRRRPVGRSRIVFIDGRRDPAAPSLAELNAAFELPPARPFASAPAPSPVVVTMPAPAAQTPPGATIDPWAMITYLREAEDRAQTRATQMAQLEIQRLHAESKDREARWRAESELQMERERLASKERIAQMELQAKSAGRTRGVDPELVAQLGQVLEKVSKVEERVEELADQDDDEEEFEASRAIAELVPSPPPAPDLFRDALTQLMPHLGPLALSLVSKMTDGRPPLSIPNISFPDPKDPSKKPN